MSSSSSSSSASSGSSSGTVGHPFRGLRFLGAGDVVAGKFRVEGLIGEGGMGVVVAATHLFLRERVALKFLRPELLAHPELVARFAFEARASAKVKSEHVARVLDVGEVEGVPFMVVEHLDGRDLGSRVSEHGPLSLREAAEYVIQACEALAEAHALGIVHRDVKPENLFLVERAGYRFVKLIDFGISKAPEPAPASTRGTFHSAATHDEMALLETGDMMGSPSYMSPEQLTQGRIDARTDIWSLGAVLYELLTGTPLFDPYRTLPEIIAAVLSSPIASVLDRRPDLPLAIAGVLARCLARDPELRFQSAAELAVALLPFAPRRARESAERAVSHVRSAGSSEPRIALPPSEAPRGLALPIDQDKTVDPLLFAAFDRGSPLADTELELKAALKPAALPSEERILVAPRAPDSQQKLPTVRIMRVPVALDSSPATVRSVEPEPMYTRAGRRKWMAIAAACVALLGGGAVRASGLLSVMSAAAVVATAAPERTLEAPSSLATLDTIAEPSAEADASMVLDQAEYERLVRHQLRERRERRAAARAVDANASQRAPGAETPDATEATEVTAPRDQPAQCDNPYDGCP